MQLINRNNAPIMIQKRMRENNKLHAIITTWKRDRKIEIIKNGNKYSLIENGFQHFQINKLSSEKCINILKEKMKIEFPRSHQIYIVFK